MPTTAASTSAHTCTSSPPAASATTRTASSYGSATARSTSAYPDASFDRFVATYVLDLLSPDDIQIVLEEAHRLLAPDGLLCLASLTTGATPPARLLTRAWQAIWAIRPALVGGCRPITLANQLDQTRWSLRHHATLTTLAISSEVVVATSQAD